MVIIEGYPDTRSSTERTLDTILRKTGSITGLMNYIGFVNPRSDKLVYENDKLRTASPVSLISKSKFIFANQIQFLSKLPSSKHLILYISSDMIERADPQIAIWGLFNFWHFIDPAQTPEIDFERLKMFVEQCCMTEKCLDSILFSIWSSIYDNDTTHEGVSIITYNMITRDILETCKNCMLGTTDFEHRLFARFGQQVQAFVWANLWKLNAINELSSMLGQPIDDCDDGPKTSLEFVEARLGFPLATNVNTLLRNDWLTGRERLAILYRIWTKSPLSFNEVKNMLRVTNDTTRDRAKHVDSDAAWSGDLYSSHLCLDPNYYKFMKQVLHGVSPRFVADVITKTRDVASSVTQSIWLNTPEAKTICEKNFEQFNIEMQEQGKDDTSKFKYSLL